MMKLIYGTHNPGKFKGMVKAVEGLNIELQSLDSLGTKLEEATESGGDPLSNAVEKATHYYKQIQMPVFSCDSGLYFEEVEDWEQPGVLIRRVNGKRLDDEQMVSYYARLARKYGGKLTAYYQNAICLVLNQEKHVLSDSEDIRSEKFYIVDTPHAKVEAGFPLNRLSVHIKTGQYYNDLASDMRDEDPIDKGFYNFFKSISLSEF